MTNSRRSHEGMSRASIAVAAFSTVVEWYDFTLYLYFATVLSRVFFGGNGAALSTTLATFAIAYLLRPLGGFIFGHIGDRFGRRRTMLMSVALMTMTMLGTALLPTHAQAGAAAGWLLFTLRCVMGFSVGGEYIAVVAYLLEGAPRNRRGLITSLASASSEIGGLLAVGVSLLTVNSISAPALDSWGWRIPFSSAQFWLEACGSPVQRCKSHRISRGSRQAERRPRARFFMRSPTMAPASCERSQSLPWARSPTMSGLPTFRHS
jgi:MFS family permease